MVFMAWLAWCGGRRGREEVSSLRGKSDGITQNTTAAHSPSEPRFGSGCERVAAGLEKEKLGWLGNFRIFSDEQPCKHRIIAGINLFFLPKLTFLRFPSPNCPIPPGSEAKEPIPYGVQIRRCVQKQPASVAFHLRNVASAMKSPPQDGGSGRSSPNPSSCPSGQFELKFETQSRCHHKDTTKSLLCVGGPELPVNSPIQMHLDIAALPSDEAEKSSEAVIYMMQRCTLFPSQPLRPSHATTAFHLRRRALMK